MRTTGHLRPDDSPWVSTEEFLKNSGKGAPLAPDGGAGDDAPQTQTPPPAADREPVDVAAEIAKTKAFLATLNGRKVTP
jgi:hypothetical protein